MLPVLEGAFEVVVIIASGVFGQSDSGSVTLPVLGGAFEVVVVIARGMFGQSDSGSVMLPVLGGALPDSFFGVLKLVKYNQKINRTARTGRYLQVSYPIDFFVGLSRYLLRMTKDATADKV